MQPAQTQIINAEDQMRDPVQPTVELRLRDGTEVELRPIQPGDRAEMVQRLGQLSPDSRYKRFFTSTARLTDRQLAYLTEIDYRNHFAWVAAIRNQEGHEQGIGIGRYIRLEDEPDTAELAIVVADKYQGRGAGTLLTQALAVVAIDHDVCWFRAYVLDENLPMLRILRALGADLTRGNDGVLVAGIDITEQAEEAFETADRGHLLDVARQAASTGNPRPPNPPDPSQQVEDW